MAAQSVHRRTHRDTQSVAGTAGKQGRNEQADVGFEKFQLPSMEKVISRSQTLTASNWSHYAGGVVSVLCEGGVSIYRLKISICTLRKSAVFCISVPSCFFNETMSLCTFLWEGEENDEKYKK